MRLRTQASVILSLFLPATVFCDSLESIFSVHTERTPYCPPNYKPDAKYVGCCWGEYQTVTSAKGPDGHQSPGCCYSESTCTGAPPIMYDWTTDDLGRLQVITPGAATTTDEPTTTAPTRHTTTMASAEPTSRVSGSTPSPSLTSTPAPTPEGNSSGGLSTGAIAGIVVSVVCPVIAMIFTIWYRCKSYKLKKQKRDEERQQQPEQDFPAKAWNNGDFPPTPGSPPNPQWSPWQR